MFFQRWRAFIQKRNTTECSKCYVTTNVGWLRSTSKFTFLCSALKTQLPTTKLVLWLEDLTKSKFQHLVYLRWMIKSSLKSLIQTKKFKPQIAMWLLLQHNTELTVAILVDFLSRVHGTKNPLWSFWISWKCKVNSNQNELIIQI